MLSIVAVVALAAFAIWHRPPSNAPAMSVTHSQALPPRHAATAFSHSKVIVYVAGAVAKPGLYALPDGKRAADAVALAGGFTASADPVAVNLAERLSDGEEIAVARIGERLARARSRTRARGAGSRKRSSRAAANLPSQPIDLNAADAASLEQLPGIGATLAQRIVDYRTINGRFASIDELADVAGMTDRRLEQISPFVLVR